MRIGVTSPLTGAALPSPESEVANHLRMVEMSGAEPVLLYKDANPLHVIADLALGGIVFSGGGDIVPERYGGDARLANDRLDPERDAFEFALMQYAFERSFPVLAVCRGMQLANVMLGGTLVEDLSYDLGVNYNLPHHQRNDAGLSRTAYAHEVTIEPGTRLHEILRAERIAVNSFHHQAIRSLSPVLRASAHAEDGVIEAIEFIPEANGAYRGFFIGVEWHPEGLPNDRFSRVLYASFFDACMELPAS